DTLAAGNRRLLDRAMAAAELEVGNRQGAVDCGVERDGEDHRDETVRPPRVVSARNLSPISTPPSTIRIKASAVRGGPRVCVRRVIRPAPGTGLAVTRPSVRTVCPR